jgi:hypothetical protein
MIGITLVAWVLAIVAIVISLLGGGHVPPFVSIFAMGMTSFAVACGVATWLLELSKDEPDEEARKARSHRSAPRPAARARPGVHWFHG